MTKGVLYWASGSPPAWRARIAVREKGLLDTVEERQVDFGKGEHKSADVIEINPRGLVPTFKYDGAVVNESTAIPLFLELTFPDSGVKLLPEDAAGKAEALQRDLEVENLTSAAVKVLWYFFKKVGREEDLPGNKKALVEELKRWDGYLEGKEFIAADQFTVADISLFPGLAILVRVGLDIDRLPNLARYHNNLLQRPSIAESYPPHWKEGDGPKILNDAFDV